MSAEYENVIVGTNDFTLSIKEENEDKPEEETEEESEEETATPAEFKTEMELKIKQAIDESVHYYLSQMKEMFMTELITHLLDQKRKYEMEDNDFNKLTEDEKKSVNKFIKKLTTK